jgi:hypothetical protein
VRNKVAGRHEPAAQADTSNEALKARREAWLDAAEDAEASKEATAAATWRPSREAAPTAKAHILENASYLTKKSLLDLRRRRLGLRHRLRRP